MGRKHCGKKRNCSCEQFLLFPQCFQKACFPGASKGVIVWEWLKIQDENLCSSIGSIQNLRTGGYWFDSLLCQYSFQGWMIHCNRIYSSNTDVHCFDSFYVGKQLVACKENFLSTGKKNSRNLSLR